MKRNGPFILSHALFLALIGLCLFAPKLRSTVKSPWSMLVFLLLAESLFLRAFFKNKRPGACDIMIFVWLLLIVWELCTSVLNTAHPVLLPCPENVFDVFRSQGKELALNVLYSMKLLLTGFGTGMVLAVGLGLIAGWWPRLRDFSSPIANVMAPIPAVVFSPYLVAVMPSFRSASALVIVLGVFWPNFLGTINRVRGIEPRILDSARMLNLSDRAMILHVLLPYVLPGIVSGLKVSATTSLLMLNFAELMGATHGMGYYVQNSITYANYTQAVAGIFCIGVVVTLLNGLITQIQKRALKWR